MPMISTFGAGSARAFGRGAGKSIYGVIQSGPNWDSSLFNSGDIIIRAQGGLTSAPGGNIWSVRCTQSWSQPYYEGGSLNYSLSSSNMQGQCYIHYRPKLINSPSLNYNSKVVGDGASRSFSTYISNIYGRHIRVAASGGYTAGSANAWGGDDPLLRGTSIVGGAALAINANTGTHNVAVGGGNFIRVSGYCVITM